MFKQISTFIIFFSFFSSINCAQKKTNTYAGKKRKNDQELKKQTDKKQKRIFEVKDIFEENILEYLIDDSSAETLCDSLNDVLQVCQNWNNSISNYFKERNININMVDTSGYTPLHFASLKNLTDVSLFLIEHGANVNAKTNDRRFINYPFEFLVIIYKSRLFNDEEIGFEFIEFMPIHFAILNNNRKISDALIKKGCQIELCNDSPSLHINYRSHARNIIYFRELNVDLQRKYLEYLNLNPEAENQSYHERMKFIDNYYIVNPDSIFKLGFDKEFFESYRASL